MGAHLSSVRILFLVKEEIKPTNLFISCFVVLHKVSNDISNKDEY